MPDDLIVPVTQMVEPWEPQDGFQVDALEARYVADEMFGGGNRGGGKTDWLLMDYSADVVPWGKDWKGILFRKTFSQFRNIIERSKELYYPLFPGCDYREGVMNWRFPNGATLQFFHMAEDSDAEKHLGLQYTWIGYDELPHWPSIGPYNRLKATCRSSVRGVPLRIRSTGNPGGPGLGWIKDYFKIPKDPSHPGGELHTITEKDPVTKRTMSKTRMFLRSTLYENKKMLEANPGYPLTIKEATEGNEQLYKAWMIGDFNVFFGKFFTMFDSAIHCVSFDEFFEDVDPHTEGEVIGSLDYGENDYTSYGHWWLGLNPKYGNGPVSYRVAEFYGKGLWPSAYAGRINDLITNHPVLGGRRPRVVHADTNIWYTRGDAGENGMNRMVVDIFRQEADLRLVEANKARVQGFRWLKEQLAWETNTQGVVVRKPKLYYSPDCSDFARCMENAVYAGDEDNPKEEINTRMEEHPCDDARYYVMGAVARKVADKTVEPQVLTAGYYKNRILKKTTKRRSFIVNAPEPPDYDSVINDDSMVASMSEKFAE
jgi:hypothetical protein